MPAQEAKVNFGKLTGMAMKNAMKNAKGYKGQQRGQVPANVRGTAKLSSGRAGGFKDKNGNEWNTISAVGVCQTPKEYKGMQIYPQAMFRPDEVKSDDEKATDAVKQVVDLMAGCGLTEEEIDACVEAKNFFEAAVKALSDAKGRDFRFSTAPQKKDPSRTNYYANGAVEQTAAEESSTEDNSGEDQTADQGEDQQQVAEGLPEVGEQWTLKGDDSGTVFTIVAVDTDDETVTLKPPKGPKQIAAFVALDECKALASA